MGAGSGVVALACAPAAVPARRDLGGMPMCRSSLETKQKTERERGGFAKSDHDGRKPVGGEDEETTQRWASRLCRGEPKRRWRRGRRGRAAQPASTKRPRAALAWKAPGAHL